MIVGGRLKARVKHFYESRTENRMERVRLTAFLLLALLALGSLPLHFIGMIGISDVGPRVITMLLMITIFTALVLYLAKKVSLKVAFSSSLIIAQALESAGTILIAFLIPDANSESITVNIIISYAILLYLTFGFLPHSSLLVTLMSISTITFVAFYPPSSHLLSHQMLLLMTILETFTCILAFISMKAIYILQEKSKEYKGIQEQVLKAFGVDKNELLAILQITHGNGKGNMTELFSQLGDHTRRHIIDVAISENDREMSERNDLASVFPMLTTTEMTVVRLIIARKSKKEIATILDKSESNIGSVRGNIRRKLGLTTNQNLRRYLIEQLEIPQPGS